MWLMLVVELRLLPAEKLSTGNSKKSVKEQTSYLARYYLRADAASRETRCKRRKTCLLAALVV